MQTTEKVPVKKAGNFNLDDLGALPSFYLTQLNHAEDKLAFYWDKTGRLELFVMDLKTNKIEQISHGELPRTLRAGYIWNQDDNKIIYTKDKAGDEKHNLHEIDLATHEVTQLTDTPNARDIVVDCSPDGKWYLINSDRHGQVNLYRMSTSDPDTFEQITAHENPAGGGKYSPDGEWIIYGSNEEPDLQNQDLYLAKPDGSYAERIISIKSGSQEGFGGWSADSKSFCFTTDATGINQAAIYNIESKEIKYFGNNTLEEYAGKITKNGKYLIGLSQENASVTPVVYEIDSGEKKTMNFPPGLAAGSQIIDSRYLVLQVNTPNSPSRLMKYDIETDESSTLLETEFGNVNPDFFTDAEHIWYNSLDETPIPAIVYKPKTWSNDKLYPGIVLPHGGPTGNYFMNFSILAQYLADLGYVILLPNVRGSTGYGVEFRDACLNSWGNLDHDDWVAGRQWIIDNASVDPERIAVFGGSYGGYATLRCVTKSPDLWAAGVAWIPVSHLKNMYDNSDELFKWFLRSQMGDYNENKEAWEASSPLNYVENITAPLMLVHGTNDPRCPVEESRNVVAKMRELGRSEGPDGDFEYHEFEDEGHGAMSDIKGRIRTFTLLTDYLYRKLS